jgi:hypothetical protein
LTEAERQELDRVQANLRLPDEIANPVYADCAQNAYRVFFDAGVSDGKLSPEEETELKRVASSLGLTIQYDEQTDRVLQELRSMWEIEEGTLSVVECDLNLQRGEVCHKRVTASLHEIRRVTQRVSYGGYTTSIKIVKGFHLRGGSYALGRQTKDVLTKLDVGELYLTNKRLIFLGATKNVTLRLQNILSVTKYSDGIEVEKGSGKNPFFLFETDVLAFAKMLQRLMRE